MLTKGWEAKETQPSKRGQMCQLFSQSQHYKTQMLDVTMGVSFLKTQVVHYYQTKFEIKLIYLIIIFKTNSK